MSDEMEKYAVVEAEDHTKSAKTAAEVVGTCPICGSELEETTTVNVLKCPKCGTRPFESDADGAEK